MSITSYFETFCSNLRMKNEDIQTVSNRYKSITKRINIDYWGSNSETINSLYVGSYGRGTAIHLSDIDMLVQLPYEIYKKFDGYSGNGQSALLQEVKKVIEKTYAISSLKSDGQIISIPFTDGINFEVLPAFINKDGSYTFANTNNGGSWKITDPKAEIKEINSMNALCNKNLKRLCRMARAWKEKNNVSIPGMLIDTIAYNFISTYAYKNKSYLYYDFMSRDFFDYLSTRDQNQQYWKAMGSGRYIYRTGNFENKSGLAKNISIEAIEKMNLGYTTTAVNKWREIYGSKFPQ